MKRDRYNATMSRCLGSSNQSRERKRREGFASDAMGHNSLWKARNVDTCPEQPACQRLLLAFFRVERDARGGDVKGLQIIAAEGGLCHGRAGQAQCAEQFPRG